MTYFVHVPREVILFREGRKDQRLRERRSLSSHFGFSFFPGWKIVFLYESERYTSPVRMPIEERNTEIKLPADMWVSSNLDVFLSST